MLELKDVKKELEKSRDDLLEGNKSLYTPAEIDEYVEELEDLIVKNDVPINLTETLASQSWTTEETIPYLFKNLTGGLVACKNFLKGIKEPANYFFVDGYGNASNLTETHVIDLLDELILKVEFYL